MSYKRPDKGRHDFTKKEQAAHSESWWQRRYDLSKDEGDAPNMAFCLKNLNAYRKKQGKPDLSP